MARSMYTYTCGWGARCRVWWHRYTRRSAWRRGDAEWCGELEGAGATVCGDVECEYGALWAGRGLKKGERVTGKWSGKWWCCEDEYGGGPDHCGWGWVVADKGGWRVEVAREPTGRGGRGSSGRLLQ